MKQALLNTEASDQRRLTNAAAATLETACGYANP